MSYSGSAQVTGGPGTGKTVTVLHRAAILAERAGQPRLPRPVLLTTFNGNLAESLHAQLDLLIPDAAVRDRIEVLNVDRLAYRVVKQARGTPVLADERELRVRWAHAAADAGLDLTPAFLKNEWEQVILAQDLRAEPAYLTRSRPAGGARSPRPSAARSGRLPSRSRPSSPQPGSPPTSSWPTRPPSCSASRERRATGTSWWTRPRTCTRPSGGCFARPSIPAPTTCSSRPTRTSASTAIGSPSPSLRISVRGRSRRLSLNYRTTQEILAWALPLLGTDPVTGLDGEADSLLGYRSPMHGPRPQAWQAASRTRSSAFLPNGFARGFRPGR